MPMRSWVRKLFTSPVTRPIRKSAQRSRLALEALEERWCPATWTVINTNDTGTGTGNSGDLRYCVNQANSTAGEDTIVFGGMFSTPQTITLTSGQLLLTGSAQTTITGPGSNLLTVDGNNRGGLNRVFGIDANAKGQLSGMTITRGTEVLGAGVLIDTGGTGALSDCVITGNKSDGPGGGVANRGTAFLTNCTISGNTSTANGGGLFNQGTVSLTNCSVTNNHAGPFNYGGGLYNKDTATLTNCTVSDNTAGHHGGGVYTQGGTLTIASCTFSNNKAGFGGGGWSGGGLYNSGATVILLQSTFTRNTADGYAGGVYNTGTANLTNCTFSNNEAGNTYYGGALYNDGTANLTYCTITDNKAEYGGGVYGYGGTLTVQTTILASNTSHSGDSPDLYYHGGTFTSNGRNLFGVGWKNSTGPGDRTNVTDAQLKLADLGDYGGPTQTRALKDGSIAIRNGGPTLPGVTTDQRGIPMNTPSTDIGAFQAPRGWDGPQVSLVVNTTGDAPGSPLAGLSLRQAVNLFNQIYRSTAITFDPTVFHTAQTITLTQGQLELWNDPGVRLLVITGPAAGLTVSGDGKSRVFQVDGKVTANLTGLTITGGTADRGGGLANFGTANLTNCTISGNTASNSGGGLFNDGGTMTLIGCTISGNTSGGDGGGLYSLTSGRRSATLINCSISENRAGTKGGGLYLKGPALNLADCTISGNHANGNGGGLLLSTTASAGAILTYCTVKDNTSHNAAGGGVQISDGMMTMTNCTVSGNQARLGGGGVKIASVSARAILANCTLSGNTAGALGSVGGGGGLYNQGTLSLTNCTVSGNNGGPLSGGGLLNKDNSYQATLTNTIVAGNSGTGQVFDIRDEASDAAAVMGTCNLIGTGGSGRLANGVGGNIVGVVDPGLAPLGYYGGPMQTMALKINSPARDRGVRVGGLTTDQRGLPRERLKPDIGAFEHQSAPLVVTTTFDAPNVPSGKMDLRGALNLANVLHGPQGVTFDAKAFASAQTITLTAGQIDLKDPSGIQRITGPAAGVTISGGGNSRVFQVDAGVTANLSNLTITGGMADVGGGLLNRGTVNMISCTITGNSAGINGGGLANYGTAVLNNCLLSDNTATNLGGGLANFGGTATLNGSTVRENKADLGGGLHNAANLHLNNSTISKNQALYSHGGGLHNFTGTATLTNCTVSGNTAEKSGGGVANDTGTVTLTASTFSANKARTSGGGLFELDRGLGPRTRLTSTIVAGNTNMAATPVASDIAGMVDLASSFNLIGTGGSGGLVNGVAGDIVGVPADQLNLAPLGDHGGPTVGAPGSAQALPTLALLPGSPAIGQGTEVPGVTTDQRGMPRGSLVDIGAFQTSLRVESTSGSVNWVPSELTLAGAVGLGNAFGGPVAISFDPAVFTGGQTITLGTGPLVLTRGGAISTWSITGPASGVTISGGNRRAFWVDTGATARFANLTITSRSKATGDGLTVSGTAEVIDCTFTSAGIYVVNGGSATITGGKVTGNANGIVVGSTARGTSTATIHDVDLSGNTVGVRNNGRGRVDATLNWWGSAGGPTGRGASDEVGNVLCSPWLGDKASLDLATPSSLGFSSTGNRYEVTPNTASPGLSVKQGGVVNTWTVTPRGTILFVGSGGNVKINGPSGAGFDANAFGITDGAVTFTANDAFMGATVLFNGTVAPEVTAQGTMNTFEVNRWTGAGKLTAPVRQGTVSIVTASKNAGFTLTNASLKSTDGLNLALSGITTANLTAVATQARSPLIVDASAFTGGTTLIVDGPGSAILFGGGSTTAGGALKAMGSGNVVLVGGAGANTLTDVGTGCSILIGGGGAPAGNTLTGNGNDILISGNTSYDANTPANIAALKALLGVWSSKTVPYMKRIDNLKKGVPGGYKLDTSTVQSNGKHNTVNAVQEPLQNWLLVTIALDTFTQNQEIVTDVP